MVGNHYLSSIIGLFFSSSSTFLTQRSKEEQAVSCRERRTDRSELVNHAWWNPNHTIYAAPRRAIYPRISAVPSTSHPLRRPTRQRVLEARQTPVHPPCRSAKALQTRQTPVHPPCCGVRVLPSSLFLPSLLIHWRGHIRQSTGQSRYGRLPGLPYFTGMWPVLSNTCHKLSARFDLTA